MFLSIPSSRFPSFLDLPGIFPSPNKPQRRDTEETPRFVEEDGSLGQGLLLSLALFVAEGSSALVDVSASLGLQSCGLRIRALGFAKYFLEDDFTLFVQRLLARVLCFFDLMVVFLLKLAIKLRKSGVFT